VIIIKLQGGLGNQMFQIACGLNFKYKFNEIVKFDTSSYQNLIKDRELQISKINIVLDTDMNLQLIGPCYSIVDDFVFRELPNPIGSNYYLDGYWQSEKYFKESSELIREDFQPSEELLNKLLLTPFIDTNTISLHVRRTDYIASNGYHPVQSIEYYQKAIETIGEYDYIFVFSDDIQWCKDNLIFENIVFIEGNTNIEDLYLMSLCKNNIIANSSFSWWGAWLNNNPDKKVIAPKRWFGDSAKLNESDIIPDNWIRI